MGQASTRSLRRLPFVLLQMLATDRWQIAGAPKYVLITRSVGEPLMLVSRALTILTLLLVHRLAFPALQDLPTTCQPNPASPVRLEIMRQRGKKSFAQRASLLRVMSPQNPIRRHVNTAALANTHPQSPTHVRTAWLQRSPSVGKIPAFHVQTTPSPMPTVHQYANTARPEEFPTSLIQAVNHAELEASVTLATQSALFVKAGFTRIPNPLRAYFVSRGITLQPTLRHAPAVPQGKSRASARQFVSPAKKVNSPTKRLATPVGPVQQALLVRAELGLVTHPVLQVHTVSLEERSASTVMLVGTLQRGQVVVNCAWLENGATLRLESALIATLDNAAAEVRKLAWIALRAQ